MAVRVCWERPSINQGCKETTKPLGEDREDAVPISFFEQGGLPVSIIVFAERRSVLG